jgi:hypothetical protein
MNKQLDELLNEASYYTPSKRVTLEANETKLLTFTGLSGKPYGVNRFLPGGTGLDHITATIAFNNGRDKRIEDVSLSVIRNLFLTRSLQGAIDIERGTEAQIELTNKDTTDHTVSIELIGYDTAHLQKKKASYEANCVPFPQPEFVYLPDTTINANANSIRLPIQMPAYQLRMMRMAMASNDAGDNLTVSIRQGNVKIKPEVYISQINDEFSNMNIILPQILEANTPFDLYVSNADPNNPYQLSMLAECYRI